MERMSVSDTLYFLLLYILVVIHYFPILADLEALTAKTHHGLGYYFNIYWSLNIYLLGGRSLLF